MRRFLVDIFKFTVYLFCIYIAKDFIFYFLETTRKIENRVEVGSIFFPLNDLKLIHNPTLVFLGSSHAYKGFDTYIFDSACLISFNLGSSSQTPIQTNLIVKKYIPVLKPKIIVYEVNPLIFSIDGVESSIDFLRTGEVSKEAFDMTQETNNFKTYLYFFHYSIIKFLHLENKKKINPFNIDQQFHKGYVKSKVSFFKHETYGKQVMEINKNQIKSFDESIALLRKKSYKIILVQAPITSAMYHSIINNNEFDSIMGSKKITYYNFNKLLTLDDSLHFFDSHHLNQAGVIIFNRKLIDIIKKDSLNLGLK